MTWEDVQKNADVVQGDLELTEAGVTVRGPIAKFKIDFGEQVYISLEWVAKRMGNDWVTSDHGPCTFPSQLYAPREMERGIIEFKMLTGTGRLIAKSKGKLDPKLVRGLTPAK